MIPAHRRPNRMTAVLACFILALGVAGLSAQEPKNLLRNASFERGKSPWKGDGKVKAGMLEVVLDPKKSHEFRQPFLNNRHHKKFDISFKVKTSEDFEIFAKDDKLDWMEPKVTALIKFGTTSGGGPVEVVRSSEWRTYTTYGGLGDEKKLDFAIHVPRGRGSLYFTDFELRPASQ